MIYEQKDYTGALFKNKRKTLTSHPDYQGSCKVDGVEMWISAWINKPKSGGDTYMSLNFQVKSAPASSQEFHDEDVPF